MSKTVEYPKQYFHSIAKCVRGTLFGNLEGRYLLKVRLKNNGGKTLTMAMMNPSKADEFSSDNTINKVIAYVHRQNTSPDSLIRDVQYINVVNIFPIYEPNSQNLKMLIDKVIARGHLNIMQSRNRQAFEEALCESDTVVLAWGDVPNRIPASLHNHQVLAMYESICNHGLENETYVLKYEKYKRVLTNKKRPRHPSRNTPKAYMKVNNMKVSKNFLYLTV